MKLVLHNYWRSSASHRVRIGLGLKQLAFDYVAIDLPSGRQHADAYRAKNPMAQVPTLEITGDDGVRIALTQSLAILEYLDECWPDPPILPHDPHRRAQARALAELVNAGIQPMQNTATLRQVKKLGGDDAVWAQHFIASGLAAFAKLAEQTAGEFCVGGAPTVADICLVPQLATARRYHVELGQDFERLLAIEARCLELPAFANATPDRQPDARAPVTS